MGKIKLFGTCLLILLLLSTASKGSIVWNSLPTLVHDAPVIAKGKISVQGEKIVLNVEKTLKGEEYDKITVYYVKWFEAAYPEFSDNENVLLFLMIPELPFSEIEKRIGIHEVEEGEMYLFGLGDQGKWPRVYPEKPKGYVRHYPELQDNASLEAIQEVVEKLLKIKDVNNLDQKVKICVEYIKSQNNLLKLTALEYAKFSYFWESHDGKSISSKEINQKKKAFFNDIHDEIIKLTESNEPSLLAESIRYLKNIQATEAFPILIKNILHEDENVREANQSMLYQLALKENIKGDFVRYKSDESMENLKAIQKQWNDWWEKNKERYTTKY